jgi:hypothetical protein
MENLTTQDINKESNQEKSHNYWSFSSLLMVTLWPGFLMACVACGIFFSLVDPMELIVLDERVQVHMLGAYTIGFLIFWALGSLSSYLTALLLKAPTS